jgi:hypothetical protein
MLQGGGPIDSAELITYENPSMGDLRYNLIGWV